MIGDTQIVTKLLRLRTQVAAANVVTRLRLLAEAVKYDPNQPRVPAGSPQGGQWTSAGGGDNESNSDGDTQSANEGDRYGVSEDFSASFTLAARRGRSIGYCMRQYAVDGLLCSTVEPALRRRACWEQAGYRLGDCIAGRPLRPLNF
jgi:hypothetical protein